MRLTTASKIDLGFLDHYDWLKRPAGNQKNVHAIYKNIVCAFDIETTNDKETCNSYMYIWQFAFSTKLVVIGRTWEEYELLLEKLSEYIPRNHKLVVYVHNLSFEFQFLKWISNFSSRDVFAVKPRKILTARTSIIEYRCSYLHSNMSLSQYTLKMGVKHAKLSGEDYDYDKIRYPWTKLTVSEMRYAIHDVLGLVESIEKEMELDGDDLYSIPATSTGYVRREAKSALEKSRPLVREIFPTLHQYEMLREAFRGGNTHANRWLSCIRLNNVKCIDISSSYPAQMLYCKYPMSKFIYLGAVSKEKIRELIYKRGKCVLMRISIYQAELKSDRITIPYISHNKCRNIVKHFKSKTDMRGGNIKIRDAVYDNGRVIECPYLETTVTDVDYKIIKTQYIGDYCFFDVYYADYGYLPQQFRDLVREYYRKKTELKGDKEQEYLYSKFKEKINALYGMMVQDPLKDLLLFYNQPNCESSFIPEGLSSEELLSKARKKAFLAYQWGVWVTSHARSQLQEGVDYVADAVIYCDTDSIKYLGDVDIDALNKNIITLAKKNGVACKDGDKHVHYLGEWEQEIYKTSFGYKTALMDEFITLGAKKYAFTVGGKYGELFITIAGVSKTKGATELEKAGGLDAFHPGFIFREGGGTDAYYNDFPEYSEIEREGEIIPITSNLFIESGEYTLKTTPEYNELLLDYLGRSIDILEPKCYTW